MKTPRERQLERLDTEAYLRRLRRRLRWALWAVIVLQPVFIVFEIVERVPAYAANVAVLPIAAAALFLLHVADLRDRP